MTVTVPIVRDYEGWRTPDESWLNMEATKDVDTFFENMVLGEEEDDKDKKDILEPMKEMRNGGPGKNMRSASVR
jgi:hypothetical protein